MTITEEQFADASIEEFTVADLRNAIDDLSCVPADKLLQAIDALQGKAFTEEKNAYLIIKCRYPSENCPTCGERVYSIFDHVFECPNERE